MADYDFIQLEKGDQDPPIFLLQYSYYLNKSATKQVLVGVDRDTFNAAIVLISYINNTYAVYSIDSWPNVKFRLQDCLDYDDTCFVHFATPLIFTSQDTDGERFVILRNQTSGVDVKFNKEELECLSKLEPFLTRMLTHLDKKSGFVKEYYRAYLFKCFVNNTYILPNDKFFKIDGNSLNYNRLYAEIPVILSDRIKKDIAEFKIGGI